MQTKAIRSPPDWKISPKFREIELNLVKITIRETRVGYCCSLKVKWGYFSAQKPESERSKSFAVSI